MSKSATATDMSGIVAAVMRRSDMADKIKNAVQQADQVDFMGFNLRHPWLTNNGLFEDLLDDDKIRTFRLLLADVSYEEALKRRAKIEGGTLEDRMIIDGNEALIKLAKFIHPKQANTITVRILDPSYLYCSIIRADNFMYVTTYLALHSGNNSPTFAIKKTAAKECAFNFYWRHYNRLWKDHAKPWTPPGYKPAN